MKHIKLDTTLLTDNVTIISDNYYFEYGLRQLISALRTECPTLTSQDFVSDIVFRNMFVSINYYLSPANQGDAHPLTPFTVDIPFNCDDLSVDEIQTRVAKILSIAQVKLTADSKKDLYEKIGAKHFRQLSRMENQVLSCLGKGYYIEAIAAELGSSEKTVSTHRRNAMRKMGIAKKSELYQYASWMVQHTHKERITLCL